MRDHEDDCECQECTRIWPSYLRGAVELPCEDVLDAGCDVCGGHDASEPCGADVLDASEFETVEVSRHVLDGLRIDLQYAIAQLRRDGGSFTLYDTRLRALETLQRCMEAIGGAQ